MRNEAIFRRPQNQHVLSPMHLNAGNSEAFFAPHSLKQQRINFFSTRIRRNVIGMFKVNRVDICSVHEMK